jgi:exodeoxyribonuclease VII small subunit
MATDKSFEQNLKALEKVVERLESGSASLDESLVLFQKGQALRKACEERLREAELKIQTLLENPDGELTAETMAVETSEGEAPADDKEEE